MIMSTVLAENLHLLHHLLEDKYKTNNDTYEVFIICNIKKFGYTSVLTDENHTDKYQRTSFFYVLACEANGRLIRTEKPAGI